MRSRFELERIGPYEYDNYCVGRKSGLEDSLAGRKRTFIGGIGATFGYTDGYEEGIAQREKADDNSKWQQYREDCLRRGKHPGF